MPVSCITTRVLIGCTPAVRRSRRSASPCSSRRSAGPWSCPRATRDRGFSSTVVSIISTGAGSVAVSARPSLPKTRCDFRKGLQLPVHLLENPARLARRQRRAASSACRGSSPRPSPACSPSGSCMITTVATTSSTALASHERVAVADRRLPAPAIARTKHALPDGWQSTRRAS